MNQFLPKHPGYGGPVGGQSFPALPAPKESPIRIAQSNVEARAKELRDVCEKLQVQLRPIRNIPEPSPDKPCPPVDESSIEFVRWLDSIERELSHLYMNIRELSDSIAL